MVNRNPLNNLRLLMWKKHPTACLFIFSKCGTIGVPDDRHFTFYLMRQKVNMDEVASLWTFILFFLPLSRRPDADRYLGYRRSIIMGGLMMGIGYCLMGIHNLPMLYVSMTLVIIGNGFFKPNISTLLGNVYSTPQYKAQKDEGYNIFYMGINVGAFICNFFGAALYTTIGWGAAFMAAGQEFYLAS
jgi:POT family proton-dependent oligopeptide transporter